jgi:hypothetical protein
VSVILIIAALALFALRPATPASKHRAEAATQPTTSRDQVSVPPLERAPTEHDDPRAPDPRD